MATELIQVMETDKLGYSLMELEQPISLILDLSSTLSLRAEQLVPMALSSQELMSMLMGHLPNPKRIWTRVVSLQLQMSCWIIQGTQMVAIRLLTTMIQTLLRETLFKTLKKGLMERGVLSPATSSLDLKQIAITLQEPKPSSIRILNLLYQGKKSPRHSRTQ